MSQTPSDLKYAATHEWARLEEDGTVTVGITDHAQDALGDVVFVELPELETSFDAGDEAGVVESVKAASDIYAPVSGEVIEVNSALENEPEMVNSDPYNDGWFYRLKPADIDELDALMSAEDYALQCESE
ncbi:MAG: glycine cleavage system protein GcvH [Gammaproteobacteria bacterium]|jgi:glycine cleavage system H protein|nr:glycine cleavage system protein GcvH [Gammaproteobacteria bacterium]